MADVSVHKDALAKKFPFLDGKITVQRQRRLWVEVTEAEFRSVFTAAATELGYAQLCTITGLDDGETLGVIYHLAHDDGTILNLKRRVPRENPVIDSVTDIFPGVANYERELVDLLGFKITGLPAGNRYPLTDDFPTDQHPLRKDWPKSAEKAGI